MARNKHPEETVNLILDVAFRLFMEKGYEHTSIQNIIDNLGGLTKGAIYHHFKSKEDILVALTNRVAEDSNQLLLEICQRPGLSGLEKLKAIFKESIMRPIQNDFFALYPDMGNNPKLLVSLLRETIEVSAPVYIQPIIEQGIADGSIETDYPAELAELVILVANLWMNPMVFGRSEEAACRKFIVFGQMMKGMGMNIIDEEMLERLQELTRIYQRSNKSSQ